MAKATVKRNSVLDTPENGIVIQNLVIRPIQRKSQDIENWRSAIRAAEGIVQIRIPLYDLYEDIQLDAVLSSLIEKRVLAVTKTKLQFVDKEGKDIEGMTDLLQLSQFRELRKQIVLAKVWGITVVELIKDAEGFRIYAAPRKHIKPKEGLIVYEQYGQEGVNYKAPPASNYILEVGGWNDFGLLMKAAQYVIYKRGGFGDWAQYAELFGIPFREARYDGFNDAVRAQIELALEQIGSAGFGIFPKEMDLTIHEAQNSQGASQLFNDLRKACNEELSILFLGQSQTTAKEKGNLGGNDAAQERTEDAIAANDKADELSILNEKVKPILANLGYPVDGGAFMYEEHEEDVPLSDRINNVIRLRKEAGLPIEDDYIYEMAGIPKPANYDQMKADQEAKAEAALKNQQQPGGAKPANKKPGAKPVGDKKKLSVEDAVRLAMADFFAQAPKD